MEKLIKMAVETHLVIRAARDPRVCTHCNSKIDVGETYHQEEGTREHLHSLVARQFCANCYAKYGEIILLSKKK